MEKNLNEKLFNEQMSSVNQSTLLHLNDDCLINIFHYLDIFDLMNVADTCTRLQSIAYFQYKKLTHFEWNQFDHLPVNADLKKVIPLIGTQITSLTFNGSYEHLSDEDYCESIHEKCLAVKSLTLIGSYNYTSIIGKSDILPWLRTIRLENLSVFWSRMDKAFWNINTLKSLSISLCLLSQSKLESLLGNNQQLESLILDKIEYQLDLRKFVKLKMLHTLSIAINSFNVSQLCMLVGELKKLKKLKIRFTTRYGVKKEHLNLNEFLEKIVNQGLEELIVNGMPFNEETFSKLRLLNLKSLTLVYPVFDKFIKNVPIKLANALDYMDSIEHIRLILTDIFVSAEDMFLMITKLQQLEELNLFRTKCSVEKDNLTAADIFERLNEILQTQVNRNNCLKLTMSKYTINLFVKSKSHEFTQSSRLKFINSSHAFENEEDVIFSKI